MAEPSRPNIFPTLRYKDASTALEWLKRAFGFEEKAVFRGDDATIHHAELQLGSGLIMFGQHREDGWMEGKAPDPLASPQGIYIVISDVDAHHDRAKAAGARIVRGPIDEDYGSREYSARDL